MLVSFTHNWIAEMVERIQSVASKHIHDREQRQTMKTRYLTTMINMLHFAAFYTSLPSQLVQVKPTVAYLEKRMTVFHEYTPQRHHAAFKICTTYAETNATCGRTYIVCC